MTTEQSSEAHGQSPLTVQALWNPEVTAEVQRKTGGKNQMAETTTDHVTIRKWAEKHKGVPAAVGATHENSDTGIIRIMFPKAPHSEHDALVEISWDEFFAEFEQKKLALLYEPHSMFSKLISRESAKHH
jgi:hypothetical protein